MVEVSKYKVTGITYEHLKSIPLFKSQYMCICLNSDIKIVVCVHSNSDETATKARYDPPSV